MKQLSIECPVENQHLLDKANKEYEQAIKNKDLHPVFLVANKKDKTYFVSRFFSRQMIESYYTFRIIK